MIVQDSVTIEAPIERVWQVFTDVERWPEWTTSVTDLTRVAGDDLAVGARVRIKQPRLPPLTWEVTSVAPGTSWTWETRSPGVVTAAVHVLQAVDERTTRVEQTIDQSGVIGAAVGRLMAGMTRRYLATEGAGLKHRCEASAADDAGA